MYEKWYTVVRVDTPIQLHSAPIALVYLDVRSEGNGSIATHFELDERGFDVVHGEL